MCGGLCLAAVMVLVAPAALAETATPRKFPSYLATPLLDHDAVALLYVAPGHSADKIGAAVDPGKFRKSNLPAPSLDTIDLGKSALRLDVADTATQPAPGTPDYTNVIVPLPPGKKRGMRRYFGLVLTTATE